jgi:hemerythrin superfamily protein
MNAVKLLKQQHREVESLFKKFEKASEASEKKQIFEQIADSLAVHATIEEKHFYPATKSARTEDLLREAVEEHLQAKRMIADLMELDAASDQYDAKVTVLKEEIEHHVEEEEDDLFPKVEKMFGAEELEDLGVVMEDLAAELEEEGSPREHVPSETGEAAHI